MFSPVFSEAVEMVSTQEKPGNTLQWKRGLLNFDPGKKPGSDLGFWCKSGISYLHWTIPFPLKGPLLIIGCPLLGPIAINCNLHENLIASAQYHRETQSH